MNANRAEELVRLSMRYLFFIVPLFTISTVVLAGPAGMVWVSINDTGIGGGHEGFNGQISKYETTNAQYCEFLNAAKTSNQITIYNNVVYAMSDTSHSQPYYDLVGAGYTYNGATNGGAARINYNDSSFTVDSGFENHPVTYVSWYGATAFCNYYGYRLPTEWEWQAVADYDGSYTYGCGNTINNSIANYAGSTHTNGTTVVGAFGSYGYGLCDMAGNVWEWTSSIYSGSSRVFRSGGWFSYNYHCSVSCRNYDSPVSTYDTVGFRVVNESQNGPDNYFYPDIQWVHINDPGVSGHEGFNGYMSKYETTNAQYCQFLNAAKASGDIIVNGNTVYGANGFNGGADYIGMLYYNLAGTGGVPYDGATNGGAARINYTGNSFTVDSGFENHPVTFVSWYGATAFCNYYGYRLPTDWEWQAVADYTDNRPYACGTSINNNKANYLGSTHPNGTTVVGAFGAYGYGLCDMAGNVWEWTSNCYSLDCSYGTRIHRGGAWNLDSSYCNVSHRTNGYPDGMGHNGLGFRVVTDTVMGPLDSLPSPTCQVGNQEDRSGNSADPVNTATGNFIHEETDLTIQTRTSSLEFRRFYNSKDTRTTSLGQGWTHSYYIMLAKDANATTVNVCWGDGRTDYWMYDANTISYRPAHAGLYDKLIKNVDGSWKIIKKNLDAYNFDSLGRLSTIIDKNGNATSLAYNDSDPNCVTSITDPANRAITLQYQSGRLAGISDFASRSVGYAYTGGRLTQVTDVNGQPISYAYDPNGYLKTITNQIGIVDVNNVYDSQGRVMQQRDGRNYLSTFAYGTPGPGQTTITDANGGSTVHTHFGGYRLLSSVKDAHGYEIKYTYDANANRTSIVDRNGRITEFKYDARGNVISTLDPNDPNNLNSTGGITTVEYKDANFPDLPTKKIDALGNTTIWKYDTLGNVKEQIDPNGNHRYWTYNGFGQKQTEIDEANNITIYTYDTDGKLTQKTDPNGNNTWFEYDSLWRLTDVTDGRGSSAGDSSHTVHTAYDKADRVLSITGPITNQSYEYDKVGHRTKTTNGRGYKTVNYYDNNGNLTKIEKDAPNNQKQTIQFTYDTLNRKTSMTDPQGYVTSYAYDAVGHLLKETNSESNQTKYTYDAQGNTLSVTDGNGVKTTFKYDWLNRRIEQYDLLGNHWYWQYDKLSRVTKYTDARGAKTKYGYDVLGRLISVTDDCNQITNYKYDKVGNLTDVNDAGGIISAKKFYDKSSRLIRQEDANGNAYEYRYDGAGNLISRKDPQDRTTTYIYDNQNRLIETHYPDSNQVVNSYDNNGNLTSSIGTAGMTTFVYDELDRLTSSTDCFGKQVLYGYDITGNRNSVTYPADANNPARTVTYQYDTANRLKKITDWLSHNWTYTVDGAGRVKQLTNPNGVKENRTYDNAGRLSGLTYKKSDDASLISYSYTRDGQGNPTKITETGTLSPNPQLPVKVSYNYDADNRLTDSTHPASYGYDNSGNLTSRTVNGVTANFSYDFENRMISHSTGSLNVQHVYDSLGNRIARIQNGVTTRYVLDYGRDMSHVLCETDGAGRITAYYIHGTQIVGRIGTDGSVRYYHSDHIGNIVALSDNLQTITDKYAYTPFGVPAGKQGLTANPFMFVGGLGVMAENDGLYFMRARFYEADTGRFWGKDAVEAKLGDPANGHKFVYVNNNPLLNTDPKGEFIQAVVAVAVVYDVIASIYNSYNAITEGNRDSLRRTEINGVFTILSQTVTPLPLVGGITNAIIDESFGIAPPEYNPKKFLPNSNFFSYAATRNLIHRRQTQAMYEWEYNAPKFDSGEIMYYIKLQ
ncbi:MAG: SUMF1/EgtB/PvdO family nonheme iron enzyme [Phycisphaerae bacterium]